MNIIIDQSETSKCLYLVLANVLLSEQELSVEVAQVNGVHVNDGDVP